MSTSPEEKTNELFASLLKLLDNFESELSQRDLRKKVQSLVPVYQNLARLGKSLIPENLASSARDRLLYYFLKYPYIPLPREELLIVAGIDQWARRVRELRVEYGWSILSGTTAKHMANEGEFPLNFVDVNEMRPDDYIMTNTEQDRDAALRWHMAKDIRNKPAGVRDKILEFMRANVGKLVTGEELRYVSKDKTEWARRVRELRTEYGWPILTKNSGRPDLPVGVYVLEQDRQSPAHDRKIPDPVRRSVLRRDNYTCKRCGWQHSLWNRSDPRHLELHHIQAHYQGGLNSKENLITLCTVCHDLWHREENKENSLDFYRWLDT